VGPLLGGKEMRYDPFPARRVSQRRRLVFVDHEGQEPVWLSALKRGPCAMKAQLLNSQSRRERRTLESAKSRSPLSGSILEEFPDA
jgi:hypothetical protein